jgi:hypothetical protein
VVLVLALVLANSSLAVIAGAQEQPAAALAALEESRSTYKQAVIDARDRLLATIEKRIEEATSAGRLDAVDLFSAQKGDFISSGTLPQAAGLQPDVRAYNSARKTAGRALVVGFRAAEQELTKARRLDEARALQEERMEFEVALTQAHPAPVVADPAELFQPNSSWRAFATGVRVGPDERARVDHGAIRFRVTERQGDNFRAIYSFEGRNRSIEVEGTLGKTTRTRQGTWRDISFFGVRNITGDGAIGPATTHKGLIRDGTFEVILPPFRSGETRVALKAVFELESSAP